MPIAEVTDTDSELMALSVIRGSGLPEPTLHHKVRRDDGEILAEIDLAFVPLLVGLEIDGDVHLDPDVRRKDDARDHELRRRGWTIRRVWWEIPVKQPDEFLRLVRRLLDDAQQAARRAS
jgi:very-short-patch-repair endonuclease